MNRTPDYVLVLDEFLDELAERGQETFHVRDVAIWHVDRVNRSLPLRGKARASAVNRAVTRWSQFLQQYWRAQQERAYRYGLDCVGYGPSARWAFWPGGEDGEVSAATMSNRLRKALTIQLTNAAQRSVKPFLTEGAAEVFDGEIATLIEMFVERAMELVEE